MPDAIGLFVVRKNISATRLARQRSSRALLDKQDINRVIRHDLPQSSKNSREYSSSTSSLKSDSATL